MSQTFDYDDFDLLISPSGDAAYTARVIASPAGQARHEFSRSSIDASLIDLRQVESLSESEARRVGAALYEAVFDEDVESVFLRSRDLAKARGAGLRIRLRLGEVPDLERAPWEYLYRESERRWLNLSTETPVIRYVDLAEPIEPLTVEPPIRVLVVLPSVDGAARDLDIGAEWTAIETATSDLVADGLLDVVPLENATFEMMRQKLTSETFHVLHFIGHGIFDDASGEGLLVFDKPGTGAHAVTGSTLGSMLADHDSLRLVVLNACEGGRTSDADPLAGAAQTLVANGIPAVAAMQAEVTDDSAVRFAGEFYRSVAAGTPIDAAMVSVRQALSGQNDSGVEWGTPALYMRAADGVVFATTTPRPQRGLEEDDWRTLLKRLSWKRVTPIVGWSMTQPALPSFQDIADRLADDYGYPIDDAADLPKVSQYVSVVSDRMVPKEEVAALVREANLATLGDAADAYAALAALPIPVYLTTNFDDMLTQALRNAGKDPTVEICPWRDPPADPTAVGPGINSNPTPERPVVYHLHGHPDDPSSMVLTEDDYFDYVVSVSRNRNVLRPPILEALSGTSLVLLGYRLEDWMFRVLVRGLVAAAEASARGFSVAVQLPDDTTGDIEFLERYLRSLFRASDENRLRVYWGSAAEFAIDIRTRWEAEKP